jgi:hypothetical protein
MIWSSGKKKLIELLATEERVVICPTRADESELLALADAAREAAAVLRARRARRRHLRSGTTVQLGPVFGVARRSSRLLLS